MTKAAAISCFTLEGEEIWVEKKNIRNMYIRICPPDGSVKISAPRAMPQYRIEEFARQRLDWIRKHKEKYPIQGKKAFLNGEKLFLWGKAYGVILEACSGKQRVEIDEAKGLARFFVYLDSSTEERQKLWEDYCREALFRAIPEAIGRCQRTVGVEANEWHIKKMKTRWGSCNYIKKRIWLNAALANKAPECLDYVLTHELVHLYEIKHDARFKAFMDSFYPNWREVKKKLNERQD